MFTKLRSPTRLIVRCYETMKKFENRNYSGWLSETKWFASKNAVLNPIESGHIVSDQLVNVKCGELEINKWNKYSEIDVLDKRLLNVIQSVGHDNLSAVQKHTFDILNRRLLDLLASSETGSGKTMAFLVPLLNSILSTYPQNLMGDLKESDGYTQYPLLLVLSPTRELAQQTATEAMKLLRLTYLNVCNVFGGVSRSLQINHIVRGCHVLVATPGRLIDLASDGVLSLKHCQSVVLDEADRMLDMGFEPQIRKIIDDFDLPPSDSRLTSLFSATFPADVMDLVASLLNSNYGTVLVGADAGSREPAIPKSIKQRFILCQDNIFSDLFNFLKSSNDNNKKILVFCNTKDDVKLLSDTFRRKQLDSAVLHGDLSQRLRDENFQQFKTNRVRVLFATAVASRGLDVSDIDCVVNYGLPTSISDYVHRVGRCGRMGRDGESVTFLKESHLLLGDIQKDLVSLLRKADQEIPDFLHTQGKPAMKMKFKQSFGDQNKGRSSYSKYRNNYYDDHAEERRPFEQKYYQKKDFVRRDSKLHQGYNHFSDYNKRPFAKDRF